MICILVLIVNVKFVSDVIDKYNIKYGNNENIFI